MNKKIILIATLLISFIGLGNASQILIDPVFSDSRFAPADKLHAGCVNSANVSIKTTDENINNLRLILSYEPEKLQILDIKANEKYKSILDTKIEYDKVVITLLDANIPNNSKTNIFTVSFKSSETAEESLLAIHKPSYVMTKNSTKIPVFVDQNLKFEKVEECEPDIIPPTITIAKPKTTDTILALDSYFVFEVKDLGKGIDKNSLRIKFNGIVYTGENEAFVRQNDYLAFYPKNWIPTNTGLELQISLNDKQTYGGPNNIKKAFTFKTATGIKFEQNFSPAIMRGMVGNIEKIFANKKECLTLVNILQQDSSNTDYPQSIQSLANKIGCVLPAKIVKQLEKDNSNNRSKVFISLFAATGWMLFCISFLLKMHYIVVNKKNKKTIKHLQSSQLMK